MSSKGSNNPALPRKRRAEEVEVVNLKEEDSPPQDKIKLISNREGDRKHLARINKDPKGSSGGQLTPLSSKIKSCTPPPTMGSLKPTTHLWSSGKPSQIQKLQAAAKLESTRKAETSRKLKAQRIKGYSWVDRNFPTSTEEIFVHKKKVEEVVTWLKDTMNEGACDNSRRVNNKICVVTGPSGAGKTATVFLAAKELGLEVKEWVNKMDLVDFNPNPLGRFEADEIQGRSQFDLFSDFLFRAAQYSTLPIKGRTASRNKLIVVEDFPNTFYRNVDQFHNNILRPFSAMSVFPVVFIIPDSASRDCNAFNLFPKGILQELNIRSISFNAVAISYMTKFLSAVCSKEGVPVDKPLLDSVAAASNGDIRCAINTLEFKLSQGQVGSPALFKAPLASKGSKSSHVNQLSEIQKDETLFIFRALGKVLYCKRDASENIETNNNVPESAQQYLRANPLMENPESIVDKIEVNADSFLSFLQQNYPPFFGSMDDIALACGFMADSEFLLSRWPFDDSGTVSRSYKEREAREEISLLIASRGLMYSNTHKTKNEWRPLKKPMLTDARTRITKSVEMAKQSFPLEGPLQMSFYTEVIPYYNKLLRRHSNNWMLDQRECIVQLGTINRFNRQQRFQDTLREKDAAEDSGDEEYDESTSTIPKNEPLEDMATQVAQQPAAGVDRVFSQHEEEYIIEEYDD